MNRYFYTFVVALLKIIFSIMYRIQVNSETPVPAEGPLIICSNHISMRDPIILAIVTKRPIHYMAKKELFGNKIFGKILSMLGAFPVDRESADIKSLKTSISLLKDGNIVGIFPEGTRVQRASLDNMKSGIGFMALKGPADILPVRIKTDYQLFGKIDVSLKKVIRRKDFPEELAKNDLINEITKKVYENIYE